MQSFDPVTCRDVLDLQRLGSLSVPCCSHPWNEESWHDEGHLDTMGSGVGFSGAKRWVA